MAEWLALRTSDHEVPGSNPAGGGIQYCTVRRFIAHSLSLLPFHCLDITKITVRLSLLTMTNPNELCDVLLFVCSKMADETNLSSKLPVADRTREV